MKTIDLQEKYELIKTKWSPHVVAELNGQQVKLAKIEGSFVWHAHESEDELFYVVQGALEMRFRDSVQHVGPGQLIIVPKGVEHCPVAAPDTYILLVEPATTDHTGGVDTPLRIERCKRI
ncbi:MAG: mannose-6-phosphate isomerase [Crocinitomicaceae bacterium]|nr:mannose-6-phosphate isomerase [Crocinitomicaceae bacterium]HBP44662.1 cupin domain-containing protein [Flavobacteriales bacterium]